MRVLLLCQVVPFPPDSGPKVKTWNLIKWLGAQHEVTLIAFSRREPPQTWDVLRRHCRDVHTVPMHRGIARDAWYLVASLCSGQPWIIARDARRAMHRTVAEVAGRTAFDVVHVDQLNMAQYAAQVTGAFTVLDAHNALWVLYRHLADAAPVGPRKLLLEREWRRLRAYEGDVGRRADAVLAVSETDRADLAEAMGTDRPISVLPIAVDPAELTPVRRALDADRIVHVGTMFWPPNVDAVHWFLDAVWPRIRAVRSDAAFDIVGARPPRALRRHAARCGARCTGYVADPTPYLQRAGVVVVPLRAGSGMRVKVLSALAQGLPVVSTTLGCEGIAVENERHVLLADTPSTFADAVLRLLGDRALGNRLGRNGRLLIETSYDYRRVYPALQPIYARHAATAGSAAVGATG